MKINDATDIRIGTTQASKVYMGSVQIWPSVSPTPVDYFKTKVYSAGGTVTFNIPATVPTTVLSLMSYSMDDGATWVTTNNVDNQAVTITTSGVANAGDMIYWKGQGIATSLSDGSAYCTFSSSSTNGYGVWGDIRSLLYNDIMPNVNTQFSQSYTFYRLFYNSTNLRFADMLSLPSLVLVSDCYREMFLSCTHLTGVPALPATTLASNCYNALFSDCTSLTTAPALPATTMAKSCYNRMFYGCSSLTTPPVLSSTSLATGCYFGMFGNCTNLTTTPALPATTLANACYAGMFSGCSKITESPVLPATTLVERCYDAMFNYCSRLNKVTCLATTGFNSTNCLRYWLAGVTQTGYFYRAYNVSWPSGDSGVPAGWTEMIYTP